MVFGSTAGLLATPFASLVASCGISIALDQHACKNAARRARLFCMRTSTLTISLLTTLCYSGFAQPIPVPEVIPCTVRDRQQMQAPNATHLDGFLGVRIDANAFNRLLKIDETRLLKGFRH